MPNANATKGIMAISRRMLKFIDGTHESIRRLNAA
jgi:hypothetical protein